jgi:hypothetical protein
VTGAYEADHVEIAAHHCETAVLSAVLALMTSPQLVVLVLMSGASRESSRNPTP